MLETARLRLRPMSAADAEFIVELLNDPDFLRHVGDKGVRTPEDARGYVQGGPVASYERHGFGLCVVELRPGGEPIGICGLLQRETLDAPDVGFALLPRHRSRGYALEAASAVIADARGRLGLSRILAITSPDNVASIALLQRLGFAAAPRGRLSKVDGDVRVFALTR